MRVNIKYTIKENFIASKGNKSDLHLGEFGRKFQTPMKFWNEKVTWCGEFSEFCWQWGIGWRLGPASGAPVQPLGGDEASRNEGWGGCWVSPASPSPLPESLLAAFSPPARAPLADASPWDPAITSLATSRHCHGHKMAKLKLKSGMWLDEFED